MNYEKKYKEALDAIKKLQKANPSDDGIQNWMNDNFPELRESEDERIRKSLIDFFDSANKLGENPMYEYGIHTDKILAWLEKQGEQKPIIEMKSAEESLGVSSKEYNEIVNECLYGEQKSAKWGEEDEDRLKDTIYFLDTAKKHYASTVELDACIDWLKSLKPKKQWKPSEEHVHWLKWAINRLPDTEKANEAEAILEDLLEQLKEL